MRELDEAVKAELAKSELFPIWCFQFTDGTTTYRYSSLDVPIYLTDSEGPSGYFVPRNFEFENLSYSMTNVMDTVTIRIDNGDRYFNTAFVDGTPEEEEATLYLGFLAPSGDYIGGAIVFEGEIDEWELDENEIRIVIGSIFSRWSQYSHGRHSASCRWKKFKGTECGYTGDESWCDRTYTRCNMLDNAANYGGFRFLPDLENKTIWWGPTPKQRMDM
jgi:hypothetical protein